MARNHGIIGCASRDGFLPAALAKARTLSQEGRMESFGSGFMSTFLFRPISLYLRLGV